MSDVVLKIHAGTGKLTGHSLCLSCSRASRRTDGRGEHIYCHAFNGRPVFGKVLECSSYYNSALPDIDDLYRTAWTLRTEKGGRMIGFKPPDSSGDSQAPAKPW